MLEQGTHCMIRILAWPLSEAVCWSHPTPSDAQVEGENLCLKTKHALLQAQGTSLQEQVETCHVQVICATLQSWPVICKHVIHAAAACLCK